MTTFWTYESQSFMQYRPAQNTRIIQILFLPQYCDFYPKMDNMAQNGLSTWSRQGSTFFKSAHDLHRNRLVRNQNQLFWWKITFSPKVGYFTKIAKLAWLGSIRLTFCTQHTFLHKTRLLHKSPSKYLMKTILIFCQKLSFWTGKWPIWQKCHG